jgi:hypothetical protein
MADCQVAGNISAPGGCFISINTSAAAESKLVCGESKPFLGAIIETVTVTGYATSYVHIGESGKAGYSSTLNCIRFLCNGEGSSYIIGNVVGLAKISEHGVSTTGFSASAASGPASVCLTSSQSNGLGMSYSGDPISFSSSKDSCTMVDLNIGSTSGSFYLQSFSLDVPSGQIPVASYTMVRTISRD